MGTQHVIRLVSLCGFVSAVFLIALVAASCGGGAGNDTPTDHDASTFDAFGPQFTEDSSVPASKCSPMSCKDLGYNCGVNADGCGGTSDCGTCPAGQLCGAGGGYSVCADPSIAPDGGPVCVPKKCTDLGYDCGVAADGCGGTINCGSTT